MEKLKQQLGRLRSDLEDVAGLYRPFGFGILRPSPAATVSLTTWEHAEAVCEPHFVRHDRHLRLPSSWLDPVPDRTYCIRWWGDKKGADAFKAWATRVYGFFRQHPELAPNSFVPPVTPVLPGWVFSIEPFPLERASGYYWTLNTLAGLAVKNPQLTQSKEYAVLDTSKIQGQMDVQVIPTKYRTLGDDLADTPEQRNFSITP